MSFNLCDIYIYKNLLNPIIVLIIQILMFDAECIQMPNSKQPGTLTSGCNFLGFR